MSRSFTIRQLTKEFGVTARTLRFYEDEGLIAPERRGQTRIYSSRDRARVILILRGRRVGFALAEIREILDLYNSEDHGVRQTLHARKKFEEQPECPLRILKSSHRRCTRIDVGLILLKIPRFRQKRNEMPSPW